MNTMLRLRQIAAAERILHALRVLVLLRAAFPLVQILIKLWKRKER